MARWVMVVLLWSVVRADEYGGVSMPQYAADGGVASVASLEDYRGYSAEAPASLDYNYEEERQAITEKPTKNNIELKTWKKPAKTHRGLRFNREESPDGEVDGSAESLPKSSRRRRYPRHRLRLKSRSRVENEPTRRHRGRYGRSRDDDFHPEGNLDKSDYRDTVDNSQIPVEDMVSDALESEGDVIPDRKLKYDKSTEYEDETPRRRPSITGVRYGPGPEDEEDEDTGHGRTRARPLPKYYPGYDDYYDMRRLNDIKNKLPMLLQRTSTRAAGASTTSDLLAMLMTAQRAGVSLLDVPTRITDMTEPIDATTTKTTTTTCSAPTSQTTTTSKSTSELSIAEKSRLSILKKIKIKDMIRGEPISKPPVLLHATNNLPTMVILEPPTSANPWLRARLVSNDSLMKLEKVKHLMRQKVLAGAKSIQDLTDNWDEMVCDYIDVSLLESGRHHMPRPRCITLAVVCAVAVVYVKFSPIR